MKEDKTLAQRKKDKLKALSKIIGKINEETGRELIRPASSVISNKIETGIPFFDYLTRGGLPRGKFIQIWAKKSVGKTSLCYAIMASIQAKGFTTVYLDFEHSFDAEYAKSFGVNTEETPISQPENLEEGLDILRKIGNIADVIIIDSIVALATKGEVLKEMEENDKVGDIAGKLNNFFKKQTGLLDSENGPCIIFINQTRTEVNLKNPKMSGNDKYPGGNALEHSLSFSLHLRRMSKADHPTIKIGEKEIQIGIRVEAKVDKTKIAENEHETIAYDLLKEAPHIDIKRNIISVGEMKNLLDKKGAWLTYCGLKFNGIKIFTEELLVNEKLYNKFYDHVMHDKNPGDLSQMELLYVKSKKDTDVITEELNDVIVEELKEI